MRACVSIFRAIVFVFHAFCVLSVHFVCVCVKFRSLRHRRACSKWSVGNDDDARTVRISGEIACARARISRGCVNVFIVCVACVWVWRGSACVCVCVWMRADACGCVRVCETRNVRARESVLMHCSRVRARANVLDRPFH